jgi:hypothetical protein
MKEDTKVNSKILSSENYFIFTPIQEFFIYKKQVPSPISLVRAYTRIFSKAETINFFFYLALAIGYNPIYPF